MADDTDDPREATTLAPDTDRGARDTQPPDEDDHEAARVMKTMVPPAAPPVLDENGLVPKPSNMPELLYNQLMKAYQAQAERDRDLLDPTGKLSQINDDRARLIKGETVEELADVVERIAGVPMRELAEVVAGISESLLRLKQDLEDKVLPKLDRHEQGIAELRTDLVAAKADLAKLSERIDMLEKRKPAGSVPPTA